MLPSTTASATTSEDFISATTSRTRPASISASQISRTSSSSDERRKTQSKKKQSAFRSFFAVKEPSGMAFQHLAAQMREEMGDKGQRPFGVPSGKIPASAESDYKKAKEKAKEKARAYQEAKQQQRMQEEHERDVQKAQTDKSSKPAILAGTRTQEEPLRDRLQSTAEAISYVSLDPRPSLSSPSLPIPLPTHEKPHSQWKAPPLISLPGTSFVSLAHSSPPPCMPATPSLPTHVSLGVRKGIAPEDEPDIAAAYAGVRKQEIAPWEDGEEEFPMRTGAKKSKGYFSTLIRR